ncbi:MAG: SUF system Fe-S cluster assembly regulator [Planctomycetota bacterium]|nr:SUF system Fe-S cluster assembly regulator [Planctomycetota bacterium]
MIRLSRMTDYGIVLLTRVASHPEREVHSASDLAAEAGLPRPTVSKILKILARKGLLTSRRGVVGGYRLARPPEEISLTDLIDALEGPVGLTTCTTPEANHCEFEQVCPVEDHWNMINRAVRSTLEKITLSNLARPCPTTAAVAATVQFP